MELILKVIASLTIAGSTVIGFILFIQFIAPNSLSPKWRYVFGKIAVWFYLFPIAIILQGLTLLLTPKPVVDVISSSTSLPSEKIFNISPVVVMTEQAISSKTAWILLIIWGLGALSFATLQIYCYCRFMKKMKQTASPIPKDSEAENKLASLKQLLGIKGTVDIAYSTIIKSPVLVGILKPTILIPASDKVDMDLGMVIHHELIHLKRRDLWVKMLVLVAGVLHWFNPFVHLLRKDIHVWSELSCDEVVVKDMFFDERKRYGETILNVMIGSRELPVRFCASLSGDGQQLKRRLQMMLNGKKMKKRSLFIAATTVLTIGIIGTSTAVWASNTSPEVKNVTVQPSVAETEEMSPSPLSNNATYDYTFEALTDSQQKVVTKEMAHYYLDEKGNVVHFTDLNTPSVSFESLTHEQKQQASKEIGHYSLEHVRALLND